jgi:pimeloyl-ACP methyl ester carboxylesterase
MRRAVVAVCLSVVTGSGVGGALGACSSSSGGSATGGDASTLGDGFGSEGGVGTFEPEIACTDTIASVYADPGDVSDKPIGAILKCAKDQDLSAAQMTAAMAVTTDGGGSAGEIPYSGTPLTSGAHVYRVLYRTTRGNTAAGYSSATLLLPETPRLGVGARLPVIVSAHGSRGQAGPCAPSLDNEAGAYVQEDFQHQIYPLVGLGFAVIAPDLAGYANFGGTNNPPPTYSNRLDVGQSFLDGARALRNVIPSSVTDQVFLTGHSQGGSTALNALSLADTYGSGGVIAGVALYSPLWFSQVGYAGIFELPQDFTLDSGSIAAPVSIWWHYTESYLLDGPDAALELFSPEAGAVVQSFVNNDCWSPSYPDLQAAGNTANDFFSQTYQSAITTAAIPILGDGTCSTGTKAEIALCNTWIGRMKADWPHLTGGAAKVPILIYYADNDTTLPPDYVQCVFNRLTSDQANYQVCYDENPVGHPGVVSENASNVVDWIASKTVADGGTPSLTHCSTLPASDAGVPLLPAPDGGVESCYNLLSTF